MAEDKPFYWLKFQRDFFKSLRIKKLRKLAGGDTYTIIYLKLQLLALSSSGYLEYKGVFETFEEEMEEEIGESADNIKITIQYLISCGLMEKNDNEYFLPYVAVNTGKECSSAERVRQFRERQKQKALQCNTNETDCNDSETKMYVTDDTSNTEKEKEKEKEIDIESKESQSDSKHTKHKYGEYNNVLLTDDEIIKLKRDIPNYETYIENLSGYIASKGAKYKSHYATIRTWHSRDSEKQSKPNNKFIPENQNTIDFDDYEKNILSN